MQYSIRCQEEFYIMWCVWPFISASKHSAWNSTGMYFEKKRDKFYVWPYICIIYKNPHNLHSDCDNSNGAATFSNGTTCLWNVWSLISTSVRCIKCRITWEIRCKGVESKLAVSYGAGIGWLSLKSLKCLKFFCLFSWNFMKKKLWGNTFPSVHKFRFFPHKFPHHVPGIYSWQLVSQFN